MSNFEVDPETGITTIGDGTRIDSQGRLLCSAKSKRSGELCKSPCVTGMRVCRMHGGSSPQARNKAKLRLTELVDPAIATLGRVMVSGSSDSAKLRAANSILDRAGWGRVHKFEGGDARELLHQRLLEIRQEAIEAKDSQTEQEAEELLKDLEQKDNK